MAGSPIKLSYEIGFEKVLLTTKGEIMKNQKMLVIALLAGALSVGSLALAAKDAKKAETAMMSACKKDFPEAVKGKKTAKEYADWVEKEEYGANAETFKKSNCFAQHEKWEVAAGKTDSNEETK